MRAYSLLALILCVILGLTGCASSRSNMETTGGVTSIEKVAVVSFAINNYGAVFGRGSIDSTLIRENMIAMLKGTEDVLGRYWQVTPASSFVGSDSYFNLSTGSTRKGLFAPEINGRTMPSFTRNRNEVVKGVLNPESARQLCSVLGVDAVTLFYSEWTLDAGKFIPTIKALTKNCVSMYNKNGKKLFYKRKDVRGEKVIGGAFAGVYINEETIGEWVGASLSGVAHIISQASRMKL